MSNNLFEHIVDVYTAGNKEMRTNAIREAVQVVALAGLNRGGFFENAAFYGGTCQRIFYNLDRFSEDLDFSLLKPEENFSLGKYFNSIKDEYSLVGIPVSVSEKKKSTGTTIHTSFIKIEHEASKLRVKIEVDSSPPPYFQTEYKLSMLPYSFMTKCYTPSSSFAAKMDALLFRGWRNRIKGRDWYDFEWYVRGGIALDLMHLNERSRQFGHTFSNFTANSLRESLREKIMSVDIGSARKDVLPFISDPNRLSIWSHEYFIQVADLMKID